MKAALAFSFLLSCSALAAPPVKAKAPVRAQVAVKPSAPIREERPVTVSASAVGRTPFIGALIEMNLHPHVAIGAGYGYFSVESISGSFIPLYLQGYVLKGNFSPYLVAGVDFITVKFQSGNSLLNSTFRGTQLILGGGVEYRFDFGLNLRIDAVRFMNAAIWSPGLAIGYSMVVF